MKKMVMLVLLAVFIAAVVALYVLIKEEGTVGQFSTCDPYQKSGCGYNPVYSSGCCFTVGLFDGTSYDECYLSYKFAVVAYKKALVDSQKTVRNSVYVNGLRVGPDCIN